MIEWSKLDLEDIDLIINHLEALELCIREELRHEEANLENRPKDANNWTISYLKNLKNANILMIQKLRKYQVMRIRGETND